MSFNLPAEVVKIFLPFAQLFSSRVWNHVQVMLVGSILTTGKRTVTSILEVMGLASEPGFQNYHRVLNRAVWTRQMTLQVKRWLPRRELVVVGDSSFASLELLSALSKDSLSISIDLLQKS